MKIILIAIAVISLFGLAGIKWLEWGSKQSCPPPRKPSSVPVRAIWKGGCDGGNWIELVSIKNEKYRFKIYRDYDGHMILEADFKLKDCRNASFNESNWQDYITVYINESIEIIQIDGIDKKCKLVPIFPAYGGDE